MVPHPRGTGPRKPHARPARPSAGESLAELLLGATGVLLLFAVLFVLLPVLT